MASIDLTNAEVLGFSQGANYVDGGSYQFGRTVSLSITAFIKPPNGSEISRFTYITNQEKARLEEIKASGFVDSISINGEVIQNVKILSFNFPATEASIEDHIQLLRVNMNLEFYQAFDNTDSLTLSDPDVNKNIGFLEESYVKYFDAFSENFQFNISDANEYSFTQSLSFSLRKDSPTSIDFKDKVKEIALKAFDFTGNAAAKVGFIDNRYADFIRTVKGHGVFNETHDAISNSYSLSRNVNLKNGVYRDDQKDELWSADFYHTIAVDSSGSATITETGSVLGRTDISLEDEIENKNEDVYENAFQGYLSVKEKAYTRCQKTLEELLKSNPDWVSGDSEWNDCADLTNKYVSLGHTINRQAGTVNYTIVFTNNPRMHKDAIFEYSIEGTKDNNNITSVTESASIVPYDQSSNAEFDPKTMYNDFAVSGDIISRLSPLFDSLKVASSTSTLNHSVNLISSSVSFPAYGKQVTYSFTYSDDPSLRNETYIRKLEKSETYQMPVNLRSSVVAANIKETNYDADQTSEGRKDLSFDCVFKRNPSSNKINQDHTNYIKTAASSILTSLKQEAQTMAYVTSPQVAKDDLSWYPSSMSYGVTSGYSFDFSLGMSFIDKKGVMPGALEY